MINIKTVQCNMIDENCYIVNDETKECMIVKGRLQQGINIVNGKKIINE